MRQINIEIKVIIFDYITADNLIVKQGMIYTLKIQVRDNINRNKQDNLISMVIRAKI